jgi:hypothetical protein
MKKISIILSVLLAACVATSCQEPFTPTRTLALNNYDLTLPKTDADGNVHFIQITSTGPWEATLDIVDTDDYGFVWCWLEPFYTEPLKDENGNIILDEDGNTVLKKIYIAEGVERFNEGKKDEDNEETTPPAEGTTPDGDESSDSDNSIGGEENNGTPESGEGSDSKKEEASDNQYRVVRGAAGSTFLPLYYRDNTGGRVRYATLVVRRLDTNETRIMAITQNK